MMVGKNRRYLAFGNTFAELLFGAALSYLPAYVAGTADVSDTCEVVEVRSDLVFGQLHAHMSTAASGFCGFEV